MRRGIVALALVALVWWPVTHGQDYYRSASSSFAFGTGGAALLPIGVLNVNTTSVSNVTTGETDLITYALPAGSIGANGKGVEIIAWGTLAANANTKTLKLYFGATVVTTVGGTTSGGGWKMTATVLRTGAAAQIAEGLTYFTNLSVDGTNYTSPAETLANAITIKATGQSSAASADITQLALIVKGLP